VRLDIVVESARVTAAARRGGRVVWSAEAAYDGVTDLAQVLAGLAAERPRWAKRAKVVLAAGVARVKTVQGLPALTRADLAAHVRLHARRYFLQNGVPLVTDAMPAPGRSTGAAPAALLAGASVLLIEAIVQGLEAAHLHCESIAPAEAALSLLPDSARLRRLAVQHRATLRWGVAALAGVMLAGASWFGALYRAQRDALAELDRLKPALAGATAVRRDVEAADEALAVLAAAESARLRRARFLADLTTALPDSAFLVSVRLEADGSGSLNGYARDAAAVVARLARSPVTRNVSLDGATNREVVGGRELERFAIRFRVAQPTGAP